MAVYLLHFCTPYKHARHYLGYAESLPARLREHQSGNGARLMEVIHDAGISWTLARTWEGGRDLERQLKRWHSGVKLCPICRSEITLEQMLAEQPRTAPRVPGRRVPTGMARPVLFYR